MSVDALNTNSIEYDIDTNVRTNLNNDNVDDNTNHTTTDTSTTTPIDNISTHIMPSSTYTIKDLLTPSLEQCKDERFKFALLWYVQTKINTYLDNFYISDYELANEYLVKTNDEFIYENNLFDLKRILLFRFIKYIMHLRSGESLHRTDVMTSDYEKYDRLYGDLLYLSCGCINTTYHEIDVGMKSCPIGETFTKTPLDTLKHYPICMSILTLMANYAYIMLVAEKKRFICMSEDRLSYNNKLLCISAARVLKNYYVKGIFVTKDSRLMYQSTIDASYVMSQLCLID